MTGDQINRVYRVLVYRQKPIGKFIGEHPEWFEELGNGTEIKGGGSTDGPGNRITFKVEHTLEPEPNTAELTLFNLAENTRREFQKLPLRVHIEAGHADEPRLLFAGDVKPASASKHNGSDWETTLLLGDGYRTFAHARVDRSYSKGTPIRTILRDVAGSMSLVLPKEINTDPSLAAALKTGEAITGWAADELTRLLAPYGYSWSIQRGRLQILKDEQARVDTIRLIEEDNGMIGVPEIGTADKSGKPPKLTVKTLLYPELVPGGLIDLRAKEIRGHYKMTKVTHEGDSRTGPWYTTVEALPQ